MLRGLTARGSAAARVRGRSLCYKTNLKARGAADLRRDSAVGCNRLLGGSYVSDEVTSLIDNVSSCHPAGL